MNTSSLRICCLGCRNSRCPTRHRRHNSPLWHPTISGPWFLKYLWPCTPSNDQHTPQLMKHASNVRLLAQNGYDWEKYDEGFRRLHDTNNLGTHQSHRCVSHQPSRRSAPPIASPFVPTPSQGDVAGANVSRLTMLEYAPSACRATSASSSTYVPIAEGCTQRKTAQVSTVKPPCHRPDDHINHGSIGSKSLPTRIIVEHLRFWLHVYENGKRDDLINGFENGFDIGFKGPVNQIIAQNHPSIFANADAVDSHVGTELSKARIAGPFTHPPFPSFICSPIALIPKKEPGKFRLIHDLSYPKGKGVNTFIDRSDTAVSYESLDIFINLVMSAGRMRSWRKPTSRRRLELFLSPLQITPY